MTGRSASLIVLTAAIPGGVWRREEKGRGQNWKPWRERTHTDLEGLTPSPVLTLRDCTCSCQAGSGMRWQGVCVCWVCCGCLDLDGTGRGHWAAHGSLPIFSPCRDLSMNNLTELQPGLFHHLRFLEEL